MTFPAFRPTSARLLPKRRKKRGKTGWLFTLKAPSYGPVMQYADNRSLRERMYRAYTTRASEQSTDDKKVEHDNTPLMTQILKLRAEEAHMLGFANFAELSLASKMADTPQQVAEFLRELAQRAQAIRGKRSAGIARICRSATGTCRICRHGTWAMRARNCASNAMPFPSRK